jgi:hypothetical protein
MKQILFRQLPVWAFAGAMLACTKQKSAPGTASLTIINAVPNSTPSLVTNFSGTEPIVWYNNALKLLYATVGNTNQTTAYSGEQPLAIYRFPDTTAHSTPLYNLVLNLEPGAMYTLFLTGTLAAPDTLFTTDWPPYHPTADSTMGIRFVNLSAGSNPVSVNITGSANGSEVSSLPYKGITDFKKYLTTSTITAYKFEVRDAGTGALLGSVDVNNFNGTGTSARRYRNFTIAYMGLPNEPATRKTVLYDAAYSY